MDDPYLNQCLLAVKDSTVIPLPTITLGHLIFGVCFLNADILFFRLILSLVNCLDLLETMNCHQNALMVHRNFLKVAFDLFNLFSVQ